MRKRVNSKGYTRNKFHDPKQNKNVRLRDSSCAGEIVRKNETVLSLLLYSIIWSPF